MKVWPDINFRAGFTVDRDCSRLAVESTVAGCRPVEADSRLAQRRADEVDTAVGGFCPGVQRPFRQLFIRVLAFGFRSRARFDPVRERLGHARGSQNEQQNDSSQRPCLEESLSSANSRSV